MDLVKESGEPDAEGTDTDGETAGKETLYGKGLSNETVFTGHLCPNNRGKSPEEVSALVPLGQICEWKNEKYDFKANAESGTND